jgi:transposase
MSQSERDDLHWLKRVEAGSMTQREAAEKMRVTARWVRKLVKRMKKQGDAVVVHGLRGRTSNRKLSDKTHRQALRASRCSSALAVFNSACRKLCMAKSYGPLTER